MSRLFVVNRHADRERIRAALAAAGSLTVNDRGDEIRHLYDSFDWRLHGSGRILVEVADELRLVRLEDDKVVLAALAAGQRPPRFATDVGTGPLRDELAARLKIRALIHLITVVVSLHRWEVRDVGGKLALRLEECRWQLEDCRDPARGLHTLTLLPMRGQAKFCDRATRWCAKAGLVPATVTPLDWVLKAAGLEPGAYSSKPVIPLTPDLDARQAVQRVCRHLLWTMRQNEAGLRADVDTEFLHDFRVAIRRTRSLLGQAKKVFPARALDEFRREFGALGGLTGPLRDLDVNLLEEDLYRSLLPATLQSGLDSHFARLREQRRIEHARIVGILDSEEYARLIGRWTAFLSPPEDKDLPATKRSSEPIVSLARRRIARQHRRILEYGARIGDAAPDAALHRLRIEGKQLRYLLELFAALFPPREIKAMVTHLKKLQDHLGEFNDLSVQQQRLQRDLEAVTGRSRAARQESAAVGGLVAILAARQTEVRAAFAATFADFARDKVSRRFARLGDRTVPR